MAWSDLSTERPVIATMAGVTNGIIPRSKIKDYAERDLGLIGEEVEFFISVIRIIENRPTATQPDPAMTDQVAAGDAEGVKRILADQAKKRPEKPSKKPRVRHPRP
jgi:DNA replication initiation complex subunit (GINS family)